MTTRIEHRGLLVHECTTVGERRCDGVAPAHPNGIRLSNDRVLLLISTLAFRGADDARSILYQIREKDYDGAVIREGVLAASIDDWYPDPHGPRCVKQWGHPVAFGLQRDATIAGHAAPHANVFVIKFRLCARAWNSSGEHLLWNHHPAEISRKTQDVWWLQCRLNDAGDDLEILQSARPLRQRGFADAGPICAQPVHNINQTYVQPVPLDKACSAWADVCHFETDAGSELAATRYDWNPRTGLYEWTQMGPLFGRGYYEASLAPCGSDWIVAARPRDCGAIAWYRTSDPFAASMPEPTLPDDVFNRAPLSVYTGGDGVIRLLSGDRKRSPYGMGRNPLYCWEIDPDRGFCASSPQVVFDAIAAGLPIRAEQGPIVDMPKILPAEGSASPWLVHRVRSVGMSVPEADLGGPPVPLTTELFNATAIYGAKLHYH